ncbi:MAG: M48 family metallopeptidase [Halieaceae bacterium]|nr:M48 family metallopeptidase [Halieaceae bacterium]
MPTYKDIDYALTRSDRSKTASIYVERDGSISVRVPDHFTDEEIEALIEQKRYWIYKHLAEWRELNAAQVEREYVNGEGFLYLGRSYRLQWVDEQRLPLMLKGGYFLLRRDPKTQADPDTAFKAFYREKGGEKIPQRVAMYAPQLGVQVNDIRVMDLKHRWASYSTKTGNINFHWRCMMAPLTVLDYIVVHELAHVLVPDHSPAFWSEVDKILPDYRERQRWLREHGAGMDL